MIKYTRRVKSFIGKEDFSDVAYHPIYLSRIHEEHLSIEIDQCKTDKDNEKTKKKDRTIPTK